MADVDSSVLTRAFLKEVKLLERHVLLLRAVKKWGPIGIVRLSASLDLPPHKVRYSLRILQKEGFIEPTTRGAAATDRIDQFFRHVDDILKQTEETLTNVRANLKEDAPVENA